MPLHRTSRGGTDTADRKRKDQKSPHLGISYPWGGKSPLQLYGECESVDL